VEQDQLLLSVGLEALDAVPDDAGTHELDVGGRAREQRELALGLVLGDPALVELGLLSWREGRHSPAV
jgi:hypothetical protein